MGQANIISHLGAGQYRVQPVFETARLQSMIQQLTDEVALITTRLTEIATEISTAASDADYALQVLNAAITNGDPAAIKAATATYRKTANLLGSLTQTQALLKLRKLAAEKRKAWLDGYNQPPAETDAWCADLTEDLTGTVGTAEIGRQNTIPIIRPGLGGAAAYSASRDGQHQPLAGSTPSAVFYNAALRPATEKWRPRYRTGIISNLDTTAHTADVALDAATSDQGININQTPALTDVPVQYMTCNAVAFADGDHVLVEFGAMDWAQPTVVGFVSDPKPCTVRGFLCFPGGSAAGQNNLEYLDSAWIATKSSAGCGSQHWRAVDPAISLTWEGPRQRYHRAGINNVGKKMPTLALDISGYEDGGGLSRSEWSRTVPSETGGFVFADASMTTAMADSFFSSNLYRDGANIGIAPGLVMGAAIVADGRIVVAVKSAGYSTDFHIGQPGGWSLIGNITHGTADYLTWKFDPTGLLAVALSNVDVSTPDLVEAVITLDPLNITSTTTVAWSYTSGTESGHRTYAADYDLSGALQTLTETYSYQYNLSYSGAGTATYTTTTTDEWMATIAYCGLSIPVKRLHNSTYVVNDTDDDGAWDTESTTKTWDDYGIAIHDIDLRFGAILFGAKTRTLNYSASGPYNNTTAPTTIVRTAEITAKIGNNTVYSESGTTYSSTPWPISLCGGLADAAAGLTMDQNIDARLLCLDATTTIFCAEGPTSNAAIADPVPQYFAAHSTPAGATFLQTESVQPLRLI